MTEYAGSQTPTTTYSYNWYNGTAQMSERITTLPIVPETQNGSNTQLTRDEYFDLQGKLTWALDERGRIAYRKYDPLTEALAESIDDCNGYDGQGNWLSLPWTIPANPLQAVTDITVDAQGRATQVLGPVHAAVNPSNNTALSAIRTGQWTFYDDANLQTIRAQGYVDTTNNNAVTLLNPVGLTIRDPYQRTTDEVQAEAVSDLTVSNGLLVLNSPIAQSTWCRWTHLTYCDTLSNGRPYSTAVYYAIPASGMGSAGVNYNQTQYGYDCEFRQNKVQSPGGTITRTTFDLLGRSIGVYVGTNDTDATDSDPTGGTSGQQAGNNMVQVTASVYDNGVAGDGNLTGTTEFMANSSLNRNTSYFYDWRDRLTTTEGMDGYCQVRSYDNLDRVIMTQLFDTTPSGTLLAQSATNYDNRGRVYQTLTYSVTGGQGPALAGYTWYDQASNVIKQQGAGANLFTKTTYDGLGLRHRKLFRLRHQRPDLHHRDLCRRFHRGHERHDLRAGGNRLRPGRRGNRHHPLGAAPYGRGHGRAHLVGCPHDRSLPLVRWPGAAGGRRQLRYHLCYPQQHNHGAGLQRHSVGELDGLRPGGERVSDHRSGGQGGPVELRRRRTDRREDRELHDAAAGGLPKHHHRVDVYGR